MIARADRHRAALADRHPLADGLDAGAGLLDRGRAGEGVEEEVRGRDLLEGEGPRPGAVLPDLDGDGRSELAFRRQTFEPTEAGELRIDLDFAP